MDWGGKTRSLVLIVWIFTPCWLIQMGTFECLKNSRAQGLCVDNGTTRKGTSSCQASPNVIFVLGLEDRVDSLSFDLTQWETALQWLPQTTETIPFHGRKLDIQCTWWAGVFGEGRSCSGSCPTTSVPKQLHKIAWLQGKERDDDEAEGLGSQGPQWNIFYRVVFLLKNTIEESHYHVPLSGKITQGHMRSPWWLTRKTWVH